MSSSDSQHGGRGGPTRTFFDHSSAARVSTDTVVAKSIREAYPQLELIIVPAQTTNLFTYAQAGNAKLTPIQDEANELLPSSLSWEIYVAPGKRIDGSRGGLVQRPLFGKYAYTWQDTEFILYYVEGRDGQSAYPTTNNFYLLASPADRGKAQSLLVAAGFWSQELHDEVLVFDGGYWNKSRELFNSIRKASWDNVILDPSMKQALIDDHMSFFKSRGQYEKLKVPWKRGIIYYGPPGNGKTVSIKATMNMLYKLKDPVPTLYVRSLVSWMGPEAALSMIFSGARAMAPCYLVFEDLDSIVNDSVRSYFLNEVDGLKNNDGIFMIGSTNHLERLDPGISKRPSRFDRKYLFPNPSRDQRVAYCHFWQGKLADNKDIEFPDSLCGAVADKTDKFSFAYIQEAFVASLLAIARASKQADEDDWVSVATPGTEDSDFESDDGYDDDDVKNLVLYKEMMKQIKILRDSIDSDDQALAKVELC
ncbi:ATP-dependent Zn protease [Pyricularia oryzae 70-15]|uniref:ATP-dependent Zn protease n=1 Tax=Pyricularia oryzae (strain 70-15 / ATCC MYA-4617 / FGSC 8958) TaxID=242507 RepID=G4MMM3_PYRO7|nr:ATP-dependent Zn protease [Pyricularia oryzae 70-15]EHA57795.1 ATP-dependent Zn protease [Pyricularia oryzae 70-15]KAI7915013.1 ATP-dependent Zn protease [Pyricularia oryzae]KAI7915470.1 ATP-dependent Zn protease [Pyricularia oryzae]